MLKKIFLSISVIATVVGTFLLRDSLSQLFFMPIVIFIGCYFGLIVLFLLFDFITSLFINKNKDFKKQTKINHFLVYRTIELINDLAHVKVKATGLDKIPADKKTMVVFNHTSNFDPMVLTVLLKEQNLIHITKPENVAIPLVGPHILKDCYMPINRDNDRDALKTILKASGFLKKNMYSIGISPEGTRNKGDVSKLLPFKDGCFRTALRGESGIVVTELYNFNQIHKNFPFKKTIVEVNVLAYLPYEEIKDLKTNEISDIVDKLMQDKLDERYLNK